MCPPTVLDVYLTPVTVQQTQVSIVNPIFGSFVTNTIVIASLWLTSLDYYTIEFYKKKTKTNLLLTIGMYPLGSRKTCHFCDFKPESFYYTTSVGTLAGRAVRLGALLCRFYQTIGLYYCNRSFLYIGL